MNWKRFFVVVFALLVALSIGSGRLAAQTATTGDVAGVVSDPSGAVVPDAKITLKDETKGSLQETKTGKDGGYGFRLLNPGPYTVTVGAAGFENEIRHFDVAVGQIATINIALAMGAATTTVTVTEAAPLIQTENGDTSRSLSEQQIQNVPNPGNDLSAIAQLAPGAIMNTQGGYGNVEAFGLPATSNLFTVDGMDDNDPFLNLNNSGATNLLLGSNEIQEADVVTNGFSTAYGTFSGIDVNYVTKSGGNNFHGNLVYYWNGSALNANDWFNKAQTPELPRAFDNANQWAASIGGPIKKDKLFFFLNTEGLRVLIPVGSTIFTPTTAFETAVVNNLTALGDTASIPYYCQNLAAICPGSTALNAQDGVGIFNLFNGVKNQASAQNNLPVGCITNASGVCVPTGLGGGCSNVPNIGAFTTLTGQPCAQSVREVPINFAPEWQLAGRVDWNIGVNDRAYLRMQYDVGTQPSFTDPVLGIFNASSHQPEYQGQLNETHTFSPTLTNQFLIAATWYSAIFGPPNLPATLATFPTTLTMGDSSLGGPGSCGVGLACDDFIWPQGRNVTQYQLGDDVSKSWNNHTFKFGVKYHKNYVSDHDFGLFTSGLEEPLSLADFANGGDPAAPGGIGTVFLKNFPIALNQPVRLYEVGGYILDDWRVKPNLTISPGLRLEHASNPTCVELCFAQLGVPLSEIGAIQPYNKLIQAGRRQALLGYQNLQWEPRISFAWQPFGSASGMMKSNFVVRGGIGIFYDIFPGQISDNLAQNPPLDNGFTILSSSIGGSCPGFVAPNQTPGSNVFDCATAAQAAFLNAFNSGASSVAQVPNLTFTQRHTNAPQYQKWNLEIQKGFGNNDSISIGYNGNHGIHEPIFNNSVNAFGFSSLPAAAASTQFAELDQEQSIGVSNYNGLTATYQHHFSGWGGRGVFQLNYTYSHAFDLVSNGGFNGFTGQSILSLENPFNPRANYGPADYDARHVVNANYVWEIPIRKMLLGHGWGMLVDGWQVSGTVFYRTGFPFTITDGSASAQLNSNNYFATVFPVPLTAVPTNCAGKSHAGPAGVSCFAAGSFPAPGIVADGGGEAELAPQGFRNAYRGPKYFDTDFSFVKRTKIPGWERGELGLGLQFFNLFNHVNFNLPDNNIADPQFGTIQSAVSPPTSILGSFLGGDASPRLIQIKASLTF
jgi:Carboxypeptidase regulatory-like domain